MVRRTGFTLIELLVVIFIVAVMIGLLLPAVEQARESARRTQCKNNLKQFGLALHNYHDAFKALPPGYIGEQSALPGEGHWAWSVMVLPYLESNPIYSYLDPGGRSLSLALQDAKVIEQINVGNSGGQFRCPSDVGPEFNQGQTLDGTKLNRQIDGQSLPVNNYVAINSSGPMRRDPKSRRDIQMSTGFNPLTRGAFFRNSSIRFRDFTDGTSNTIVIGERVWSMGKHNPQAAVVWGIVNDVVAADGLGVTEGGETRVAELANVATYDSGLVYGMAGGSAFPNERGNISRFGLSSLHGDGLYILLGDGSVRYLDNAVEHKPDTPEVDSVYERLFCIEDGDLLSAFE